MNTQSSSQNLMSHQITQDLSELVPLNNEITLKDNLIFLKNNILNTRLLSTIQNVSILKEKDYNPFWKQTSLVLSEKLLLPIETDYQDLDLKSLKQFSKISPQLSQLSTIHLMKINNPTCHKTLCHSLQISSQDTVENENIKLITKKIRFYPNTTQKLFFNKCIGTFRYFYNKSNQYVKNLMLTEKKLPSAISVRNKILIKNSDLSDNDKWQAEIPYDTRQAAIFKLINAYKTAFSLLKKKVIKQFDVKFLKRKAPKHYFEIDNKAIRIDNNSNIRIFSTILKDNIRIRKRDRLKIKNTFDKYAYTNTIIKKEYDKWYICLVIPKEKLVQKETTPIFNSVFLDPGVKTFQTFYSPDGICGKLGNDISNVKLKPIITKFKKILKDKRTQRNKKNVKKRCNKLITKVKHIISDLHNQTSTFLTSMFKTIIIPIFEVQKMVSKTTRSIHKPSVINLLHLSHYKFRMKLTHLCAKNGTKLYVIDESYTSKTCGKCGTLKSDLGNNRIFNCDVCNLVIDRDLNAARNICIKNVIV